MPSPAYHTPPPLSHRDDVMMSPAPRRPRPAPLRRHRTRAHSWSLASPSPSVSTRTHAAPPADWMSPGPGDVAPAPAPPPPPPNTCPTRVCGSLSSLPSLPSLSSLPSGTFGTPRRPTADASTQTESTWLVTTVIAILLAAAISGCAIAGATPGVRFVERCETPTGPQWPAFYAIKRMGPWWNAYVDAADSIATASCIPGMVLAVGHTVVVALFAVLIGKACTAWHVNAQNRGLPPAMAHVWRAAEITTARAASAAATTAIAASVATRAARRAIARCPDATFVALAILGVVLAFSATAVAPTQHLSLAGPFPASARRPHRPRPRLPAAQAARRHRQPPRPRHRRADAGDTPPCRQSLH